MAEDWDMYVDWNPWHGCTKISARCLHCYVFRQDEMYSAPTRSDIIRKTANFNLPVKRRRDKTYKIASHKVVFTCFTSDFLHPDADSWRQECWDMIRQRSDCIFYFFTKRIDRMAECLPSDWGNGYPNVMVGCTVENQAMADLRLPIFLQLPICHKSIMAAPILSDINLRPYLSSEIEEVAVSGESGVNARVCDYNWVLNIRQQCIENDIAFRFHQTGAFFLKDERTYRIHRKHQLSQAHKANIDYKIGRYFVPETIKFPWPDDTYHPGKDLSE